MYRKAMTHFMRTDFFSRQTLELTFRLLRNNHPLLANAVKQTLDSTTIVAARELPVECSGDMFLNQDVLVSLKAHTIGKIVSALTDIGEHALKHKDLPPSHITLLRSLIEDWVHLTEWVLQRTSPDTNDRTAYH